MNISKHRLTKYLPIAVAVSLPLALGACSSSSSSPPPKPTVNLASDVAVTEGNTGTTAMSFTVQLSAATTTQVDVTYTTADGTATTADNDYIAASGTLSFAPNETSKTVDVSVNGDTAIEADETLTLTISSVSTNATLGTATRTGTINNDDTNFVLFMADKDTDGTVELYKTDGASIDRVNAALGAGGNVTSFALSPDRNWIAYVADQATDEVFELYVRPADLSSAAVKVSLPSPAAGGDVTDNPVWAPDSSRIAYRNDQTTDERFDLSTVTPTGTGRTIVTGVGGGPGDVVDGSYSWSPDSSLVAYMADQASAAIELWTNDGDAQLNNNRVNGALVAGGNVTEYAWAPNGSKIAYRADLGTDETFELYTADPDGSNQNTVGNVTGTGVDSDIVAGTAVWAPDSSRIAFISDNVNDGEYRLHTNIPAGGSIATVSDGLTAQTDVVGSVSWAPDSSRIAYIADRNSNDVFELFTTTPTDTTTSQKVNDTPAAGNVSVGFDPTTSEGVGTDAVPAWSPDSSTLIYAAEQDVVGVVEVYTRAADGSGNSIKVSGTMTTGGDASLSGDNESWSPDGSQILYRADQLVDGTDELWTSPPTGALPNNVLTASPPPSGVTTSLKGFGKWSPDSSYVAYASEQDTAGKVELFAADPDGNFWTISGTLVSGGDVDPDTFVWAP